MSKMIDDIVKKSKKNVGFGLQLTAMVDMFTIMIVFLLKSYDTSALEAKNVDNLKLPVSVTATLPEEALLMLVSQKAIFINNKKIIEIKDGKIGAQYLSKNDEDYIELLFKELNSEAKKIKEISKKNPLAKFEGKIFMQADKELHYSVLRKVLYTATLAGYGDLRLAALDGNK